MELELVFVKALRLLHSKAHDSTEQLRQLLDDCLRGQLHASPSMATTGASDQPGVSSSAKHVPNILATASSRVPSKSRSADVAADVPRKSGSVYIKEEADRSVNRTSAAAATVSSSKEPRPEKRTYEKIQVKQEPTDTSSVEFTKRIRTESPKTILSVGRSSPAATTTTVAASSPSYSSSSSSSLDKDSTSGFEVNPSAADIAVEMGLVCLLCRSFDVASGNTLVECQECHGLYHQECHKPPITDQDINDPRLVWYCTKCTKNMKKMVSKTQKTAKPSAMPTPTSSATGSSKNSETILKPTKKPTDTAAVTSAASIVASQQLSTHIFKRVEPKTSTTTGSTQPTSSTSSSSASSSSTSNKPIGLAGLAASLSGKSHKGTAQSSSSVQKQQASGDSKKTSKPLASPLPPVTLTLRSGTFAGLYTAVKPEPQGGGGGGNNGGSSGNGGGQSLLIKSSSTSSSGTTLSIVKQPPSNGPPSVGGNGSPAAAANAAKSAAVSSGGGGGGGGASSSSLMSADKRLQIMKKKAAAKMQEKRRTSNNK